MQSSRMLGIAALLGGAIVLWIAAASANVANDQLGDPIVGHFAQHTIRYLVLATAALLTGGFLAVAGGLRTPLAAQKPRRASRHIRSGSRRSADRL